MLLKTVQGNQRENLNPIKHICLIKNEFITLSGYQDAQKKRERQKIKSYIHKSKTQVFEKYRSTS